MKTPSPASGVMMTAMSLFNLGDGKMKKLLAAVSGLLFAGAAYASCTTHTYFVNGKYITCTTCCYNGNCNTSCF
jgi:hypothetical protein